MGGKISFLSGAIFGCLSVYFRRKKSLLNLATFSQEIAYFGDFWLYVEISAFLMSGVLKKNGVLKVPICQHAWPDALSKIHMVQIY